MSWDETERILGLYDAVSTPCSTEFDSSRQDKGANSESFKQQAARSGTPLPMEHLSLSASDSDTEIDDSEDEYAQASWDTNGGTRHVHHPFRDSAGRYASMPPGEVSRDWAHELQTLDQYDQEASRHEEEALRASLGISIPAKEKSPIDEGRQDDNVDDPESLTTSADDWRVWTEYRPVWEQYQAPVPAARFIANQKPRESTSDLKLRQLRTASVESAVESDASFSSRSPRQSRQQKPSVVELRARDPQVYAAMQNEAQDDFTYSASSESDISDADVPAQSVENTSIAQRTGDWNAMDWER